MAPSDPALIGICQEQDTILEEIQNELHKTGNIALEMKDSISRQRGDIEVATEGVEIASEHLAALTKKAEKVEREAQSNLFLALKLCDFLLFAAFICILVFGLQYNSKPTLQCDADDDD